MSYHAYLFEARGIQRFLFSSGKLRDMLNGSELIDYICAKNGYLDQVLEKLDLAPATPRRAGGAFYLIFNNKADVQRMQATWRLAVAQWLPGLECVDAVVFDAASYRDAVNDGLKKLHQQRNVVQADLPTASPLTERSPRTGLAAVDRDHGESLDAMTQAIRAFNRPVVGSESLTERFLDDKDIHWPSNFEQTGPKSEQFPLGERRLVGLVHADGNGLGEVLRQLKDACAQAPDAAYDALYRCFSEGVTTATVDAAREACVQVLLPKAKKSVMPARPLVLGGDDVSIIIRADLALPYTQAFLLAFERHSQIAMDRLRTEFENHKLEAPSALPLSLTACAGIVFMKCSQPFYSAYNLAEGLCKQAKKASRQHTQDRLIPSSVSFLKVGDSVLEDVDQMIAQTQTATHGNQQWSLGLPAYGVRAQVASELPQLEALSDLYEIFADREKARLNDRPLREIATLTHVNLAEAKQSYRRWKKVAERQSPNELRQFDQILTRLIGQQEPDLPFGQVQHGESFQSPLADLLCLLTVRQFADVEG